MEALSSFLIRKPCGSFKDACFYMWSRIFFKLLILLFRKQITRCLHGGELLKALSLHKFASDSVFVCTEIPGRNLFNNLPTRNIKAINFDRHLCHLMSYTPDILAVISCCGCSILEAL